MCEFQKTPQAVTRGFNPKDSHAHRAEQIRTDKAGTYLCLLGPALWLGMKRPLRFIAMITINKKGEFKQEEDLGAFRNLLQSVLISSSL